MDVTMRRVSPEERDKVQEFVFAHFWPDMPLLLTFGLQNPPRPPPSQQPGAEDFTLKAVDALGETVAVAINKYKPVFHLEPGQPYQVMEMVELMRYAEQKARLDTLPERTIELRVLAVRREWRHRGLARRLAEESMRVARESGFKAMNVCCTNEYTAKLARSLGWRELYRLPYRQYSSLIGREVDMKITPPHEYFYYYATDL